MPRGVALFDLDQTLIPWDTQLLFVNWVIKHEPVRVLYLLVFVPFAPFAKLIGTEGMKRIFLTYLFGMERKRLEELVSSFVSWLIPEHTYPEIVQLLEEQKKRGHQTVLMTASPAFYGKEVGKALGFDLTIGTDIDLGKRVRLFPDIIGGNNKGENKLTRLKEKYPDVLENFGARDSAAFSDSHADLPMLRICKEATMVNPTTGLKNAAEPHWALLTPPRPTRSKLAFAIACARQALGLWPIKPLVETR